MSNNAKKKSWLYYLTVILIIIFGSTGAVGTITSTETIPSQETAVIVEEHPQAENQVVQEEQYVSEIIYSFRNEKLLNDHYEKHGIEMGFDSAKSYAAAANEVIHHPDIGVTAITSACYTVVYRSSKYYLLLKFGECRLKEGVVKPCADITVLVVVRTAVIRLIRYYTVAEYKGALAVL